MSSHLLPDSYEGILDRVQAALNAGDVEEAIALSRRLVERIGRLSDKVLDRRPDLREMRLKAMHSLAFLLHREARYAEAIEITESLLEFDPEHADVWRRDLAILRVAKGEVDTGLADLQALAEELPDPWNWLALGIESRIEGRFAESQAALDHALEAGPAGEEEILARVYYQRFLLFEEMGRLDDAVAAWEEAVVCDPQVGDTIRDVYTMLTAAGRYGQAKRYIARDSNALQAGLQRGLVASLTGDLTGARRQWQSVADLDPGGFDHGHDCWAEAVLRLGDPKPALERLQGLLLQYRTSRLAILAGIAWAMHGDQSLAASLFQEAIDELRKRRPPKRKLDSADWRLLESLVADSEMKTALKAYFAVVETVWG